MRTTRPMKKGRQGRRGKKAVYEPVEIKVVRVRLTGPITVGDLATQLEVAAATEPPPCRLRAL